MTAGANTWPHLTTKRDREKRSSLPDVNDHSAFTGWQLYVETWPKTERDGNWDKVTREVPENLRWIPCGSCWLLWNQDWAGSLWIITVRFQGNVCVREAVIPLHCHSHTCLFKQDCVRDNCFSKGEKTTLQKCTEKGEFTISCQQREKTEDFEQEDKCCLTFRFLLCVDFRKVWHWLPTLSGAMCIVCCQDDSYI